MQKKYFKNVFILFSILFILIAYCRIVTGKTLQPCGGSYTLT